MSAVAYKLPYGAERPGLALVPPPTERLSRGVYWRRRVVVAVIASIAAVALYGPVASAVSSVWRGVTPQPVVAPAVPAAPPTNVWTVRQGDTLWGIVSATRPGEDPRPIVSMLNKARNGLPLQVGERVVVP